MVESTQITSESVNLISIAITIMSFSLTGLLGLLLYTWKRHTTEVDDIKGTMTAIVEVQHEQQVTNTKLQMMIDFHEKDIQELKSKKHE